MYISKLFAILSYRACLCALSHLCEIVNSPLPREVHRGTDTPHYNVDSYPRGQTNGSITAIKGLSYLFYLPVRRGI